MKSILESILRSVADSFGVPADDLMKRCRRQEVIIPRHVFCFIAHRLAGQGASETGRFLKNRDHACVINGCQRVEDLLLTSDPLAQTIEIAILNSKNQLEQTNFINISYEKQKRLNGIKRPKPNPSGNGGHVQPGH